MLLMPLLSLVVSANDVPQQPLINARWLADDTGSNTHSYRVTFADDLSYQCTVDVQHEHNGTALDIDILQTWDIVDGNRVLDLQLNSVLSWSDVITVTLTITHHDGQELAEPMVVDRIFEVGTWNQPMDDLSLIHI